MLIVRVGIWKFIKKDQIFNCLTKEWTMQHFSATQLFATISIFCTRISHLIEPGIRGNFLLMDVNGTH